jgi:folylpolyglutamate synthase/dihydropteroate synthase
VSFVRTTEVKVHDNLAVLLPITSHLIVTSFQDEVNDHRSTDPQFVQKQCEKLGYNNSRVVADPDQALKELLGQPEAVVLVTGSFFLLQHVRARIMKTI